MSLWKLRVGAEAYYLDQVASGLDDYYSGQGETVGRWIGNAASGLGLEGEVTGEDLRAVLAGLKPGTGLTPNGEQLRAHPPRVPGFDLTFSVPKSVSVAYALGDPLVQGAVIEASEVAVAQAVAWLEREACHVRRGTNRQQAKFDHPTDWGTRRLPGAGFVAAQFRHRTSRAGDPQLHWHVLVANTTVGRSRRTVERPRCVRSLPLAARRWCHLPSCAAPGTQPAARCRVGTVREGFERDRRDTAPDFAPVFEAAERDRNRAGAPWSVRATRRAASDPRHPTGQTLIDTESLLETWQHEATTAGWGPEQLDELLGARRNLTSGRLRLMRWCAGWVTGSLNLMRRSDDYIQSHLPEKRSNICVTFFDEPLVDSRSSFRFFRLNSKVAR